MIEIRGRKFRDHLDLYDQMQKELEKSQPVAEPEQERPETEDEMLLREQIEAHKQAHEPTEQKAFESGVRLVGEKTMRDWERWHDQ